MAFIEGFRFADPGCVKRLRGAEERHARELAG
jgi:hypothetical protein